MLPTSAELLLGPRSTNHWQKSSLNKGSDRIFLTDLSMLGLNSCTAASHVPANGNREPRLSQGSMDHDIKQNSAGI